MVAWLGIVPVMHMNGVVKMVPELIYCRCCLHTNYRVIANVLTFLGRGLYDKLSFSVYFQPFLLLLFVDGKVRGQ